MVGAIPTGDAATATDVNSEIAPADLRVRAGTDHEPFVLDVRPADDYEEWHVPGSTNVSVSEQLRNDPEAAREALSAIPADREVVVVRAAGSAAELAADHLREMGYDVSMLACNRP